MVNANSLNNQSPISFTVTSGNLLLDNTNTTATTGIIEFGGSPFISNYGTANTFVGESSGNTTMTGAFNTAAGQNTLTANISGTNNVAVGSSVLQESTTGSNNVVVGDQSLSAIASAGSYNVAFGYFCLPFSPGSYNTVVGSEAADSLQHAASSYNTAIGVFAMGGETSSAAANNVVLGFALTEGASGNNVAIGYDTMLNNTSSGNNVAIGFQALRNSNGSNAGGNIALGYNAATNLGTSKANNIIINNPGTSTDVSTLRIGQSSTACFIAGISGSVVVGSAVLCNSSGQLGTSASSLRYKKNVQSLDENPHLEDLRPVKFTYKNDPSKRLQFGLIAEEVEKVIPDLVLYNEHKEPESVLYDRLTVLLLKEMQQLHREVELLERSLAS